MKEFNDKVMESLQFDWGCTLEEAVQLRRASQDHIKNCFIYGKKPKDVAESIMEAVTA